MNVLATAPDSQAALSPAAKAVLLTGSAGFLFANFTAQVFSAHFGMNPGAAPLTEAHAWTTAVYTLASFVGVTSAQSIEKRFGTRMYFVWGALLLAVFGFLAVLMPSQAFLIAMRAFEGFASGSFGPKAFLAASLFRRNGRLSMTMALGAFFLLVAGVISFVMYGASESFIGQRGLFLVQFALGSLMAIAGLRWLPRHTGALANRAIPATAVDPQVQRVAPRRRRRTQRRATPSTLRSPAA